jgi:hypothetical protein
MRCNGVSEVTSRGARDRVKVKLLCLTQSDRNNTVLERECRVTDRIVFNIEFLNPERISKIFRSDERCEPGIMSIGRFSIYRKEIGVTP